MNFTLDDSSSELIYSSGWAIQSHSDPNVDRFFQSTYHVAQAVGASVDLNYSATAIYIYGSTGPGHGSYSVQFDNAVITKSAAVSNETMFQQLLFQRTFDTVNENHFLSFVANPDGISADQGSWVDIDYIVFTDGSSNTTNDTPVATRVPPWVSTSSSSTTPTSSAAASSSKSDTVPIALASMFGGILGLLLFIFITYLILSRLYNTRRARERQFRYGRPSAATPTTLASSRISNLANRAPDWFSPFKRSHPPHLSSQSQSTLHQAAISGTSTYAHTPIPPQSPGPVMSIDGSQQSNISSTVEKEGEAQRADGRSTPLIPRAFLASSPMQFLRGKPDDANSMRTDFLQV